MGACNPSLSGEDCWTVDVPLFCHRRRESKTSSRKRDDDGVRNDSTLN